MMLYDARSKSVVVAYLLWFFLGHLGAHRFYLGHIGVGLAWLAILVVSIVLSLVLVGFVGLAALGIWWLIDGFRLAGLVRDYNERVAYGL